MKVGDNMMYIAIVVASTNIKQYYYSQNGRERDQTKLSLCDQKVRPLP